MILLIAWITIFSLTSSVSGLGSFTYNEMNPFETKPQISKYLTYFDGTVVVRIINVDPNKISLDPELWVRPMLSLRIIYPNGTVSEMDKDLEIPEFNWHITQVNGLLDPVNIFALQKGYLLVRYFNASNPDDLNTYEEWGRIIDWNGNSYNEVYFSKAYIENGIWNPTATNFVSNVNPEKDPNKISLDPELWVRPMLSLRIIYPNGTVSEMDKDLEIPEFNWHITQVNGLLDPVNIFALQKGYLLVRYFNASNPDDLNTYEEWGRIIDWNGNSYNEVYFSKAYIENGIWNPTATNFVSNVNPEKGFIKIDWRKNYVEWQQYTIDDTFNFIKLSYGNLPVLPNITAFNVMGTVDEGYSMIMGTSTNSSNDSPLEINAVVYAFTKGYNDRQFGAPKLIYQSNLANITISDIFSGISSTGIGQVCTLNITQNFVTGSRNYYVKLNFLSSGSVTEIIPIPLDYLPVLPSNSTGWLVASIPYGGYLFYSRFPDETVGIKVYVYYFDEYKNKFRSWKSPEPMVLNLRGIFIILPNNTMLLTQIEDFNSWSFSTVDIPKLANSKNNYSNFQVDFTSPSINDNISTLTNTITITYYDPVELSDGNITIYKIDNSGNNIIRQFVNGIKSTDFCSISDDGLTITVKVIKSTFSNPSSQYYIKVDSNFARSQTYKESLMGIYNIWKFNTNTSEEIFADTISGVLRLTAEGTEYYENLNSTEKSKFFFDLQIELSKIIPVDIKRLSSNEKTQIDTTVSSSRQILVSLNILNIESSKEEKSVASIVDDLNEMIKYKSMTSISLNPTTKYLDGDFGFKPKQNLWDEYKWKFSGIILTLVILVILSLIAKKMESKGHNVVILQLGLIIFDFIMDVLFVSQNGKVIEVLYIPSVIFLTVPIGINTIWAFHIISYENKSKAFLDWFSQHEKVASVFTILSSADIEALRILHSNLAGFKFFQAPISTKGKNKIFWVSCLTIFVEDIPQLIIQLMYNHSVVTYDIIPLLALVSSCISLLINIIGRLFQAINSCRPGALEHDDQDDFQRLQTPVTERSHASEESISHSIDIKEENEKNSDKNNSTRSSSKSSFQEKKLLFQAINSCRPGALEHDDQDDFQRLQTPVTERSHASEESISHSIDIKEENEKNSDKNNSTRSSSKSSFQEVIKYDGDEFNTKDTLDRLKEMIENKEFTVEAIPSLPKNHRESDY
ncbi:hypothetical protein Glove_109g153 [Diversispora epigaea]|uniref:Uncharacterized protein n=1 Tax=Diversispora epigaea TaxID=1348612 RepID=A0A397J6W7_9GLOM|nr:hypothetical protein Glove_109g153 [Diversispora epigaea]